MTTQAPVLNPIQRAWLQEIGIDARLLAQLAPPPQSPGQPSTQVAEPSSLRQSAVPAQLLGPSETRPDPAVQVQSPRPQPGASESPVRPSRGPVHVSALLSAGRQPAPVSARPVASPKALPADTTLEELCERVEACDACALHQVRSRTVVGEGVVSPRWMFIGEAPGEYDESMGRPFQGRAGELLQTMLASVGIDASTPVYFTNVLKCRPMGNRQPLADEIAACLPFLRRQITLLRPECLVALGRVSAAALLEREAELEELRGSVHDYVDDEGRRIPLVVTHHPAALLLHGQFKAEAWRDLNLLKNAISTPDHGRAGQ